MPKRKAVTEDPDTQNENHSQTKIVESQRSVKTSTEHTKIKRRELTILPKQGNGHQVDAGPGPQPQRRLKPRTQIKPATSNAKPTPIRGKAMAAVIAGNANVGGVPNPPGETTANRNTGEATVNTDGVGSQPGGIGNGGIPTTEKEFGITFTTVMSTKLPHESVFEAAWKELRSNIPPISRNTRCQLSTGHHTHSTVGYNSEIEPHLSQWSLIRDFMHNISPVYPAITRVIENPTNIENAENNENRATPTNPEGNDLERNRIREFGPFLGFKWVSPIVLNPHDFLDDFERLFRILSHSSLRTFIIPNMAFHVHVNAFTWSPENLDGVKKFCAVYLLLEDTIDLFHPENDAAPIVLFARDDIFNLDDGIESMSMLQAWRRVLRTGFRRTFNERFPGFRNARDQILPIQELVDVETEAAAIVSAFENCRGLGEVVTLFNPAMSADPDVYGNHVIFDDILETTPAAGTPVVPPPTFRQRFMVSSKYKVNLGQSLYHHGTVEFRQCNLQSEMFQAGAAATTAAPGSTISRPDQPGYLNDSHRHAVNWTRFCLFFVDACASLPWTAVRLIGAFRETARANTVHIRYLWRILAAFFPPDQIEVVEYFYGRFHERRLRLAVNERDRQVLERNRVTMAEFRRAGQNSVFRQLLECSAEFELAIGTQAQQQEAAV